VLPRLSPCVALARRFLCVLTLALTQAACANTDMPAEQVTVYGVPGLSVGALVPVTRPATEPFPQQVAAITSGVPMGRPLVVTALPAVTAPFMPQAAMASSAPAPAASAEMCRLTLLTSVQMQPMSGGTMLAPVTLENAPKLMLVDTGGLTSQLWESTAKNFRFPEHQGSMDLIDIDGNIANKTVRVGRFRLGALQNQDIDFQIYPNQAVNLGDERIVGLLAPNLFAAYDIDFDFGANTLSYFSQKHCDGKIQYWPAATVAVVPFTTPSGHISIPVTIDGHKLTAIIDTGASNTIMTMNAAKAVFGLTSDSDNMESVGAMPGGAPIYRHAFANLLFEGVSVSNPRIVLIPDMTGKPANTGGNLPDVIIGMDVIKNLHIYIAFKEKKIYVSQVSAVEIR
jgi:predicted aspartyl protease